MLEWWEAALLSVATAGAGALIGLITAYWTHRWTTSANRESEERQAKRRVEEEQRQVIREIRRVRVQPVMQFLELCRERLVGNIVHATLEKSENAPEETGEWRPDEIQLAREYGGARVLAMSIPGLQGELEKLWTGLGRYATLEAQNEMGPSLQSAAELIEQYIVGAEPHESSADTQE